MDFEDNWEDRKRVIEINIRKENSEETKFLLSVIRKLGERLEKIHDLCGFECY